MAITSIQSSAAAPGVASLVKRLAGELGFALCGIAEARPTSHAPEVLAWLAAGRHGEMRWLADHVEKRLDPRELLPGARSVICVADEIGANAETKMRNAECGLRNEDDAAAAESAIRNPQSAMTAGRIARYAQLDDYHKVLKKRLQQLADILREQVPEMVTRVCVDTAPVLEREHAMRAGIGWTGKNTLLINPRKGSHLLLGEIITTLEIEPDEPQTDHCGTCRRCIDACPTGCISPYSLDASRCISYLNIEHRGLIDPQLHAAMGDWLYGCDICQDVCPFNAGPEPHHTPPQYAQRPGAMPILDVLSWTEDDRRAAFTRSAMKRAKLHQMKRNALIVAGNLLRESMDAALLARIRDIAADESEHEVVRQTAREVLDAPVGQGSRCR